jgi:hypothetical protein
MSDAYGYRVIGGVYYDENDVPGLADIIPTEPEWPCGICGESVAREQIAVFANPVLCKRCKAVQR